MKKISMLFFVIAMIFSVSMTNFAMTKKKYYAKFMPVDYSNWVWQEIPNVTSCQKTSDGLQYIIKYRGTPEPRVRIDTKYNYKEYDLTMTIGIDNVLIYEYEE